MKCCLTVLLVGVVIFAGTYAAARGSNAAISGTVTDTTRAIIPGVQVNAQNTQTGVVSTTITNEAGIYNFPSLQPGVYRVTAELPGFKKLVNNGVNLEVGARVSLNLQLEVAGAGETVVEVTAQMETALGTSSIGGMITGQKVQELPLPSRNALDLVATQAGIVGENVAGARIGSLNVTRDRRPRRSPFVRPRPNRPTMDPPNTNTNINDLNFGRITSTRNIDSSQGNRIVVLNARINF